MGLTVETFNLAQAKAWYASGKTTIEIADDQGCAVETARRRLREAGVKMRPSCSKTQRQAGLESKLLRLLSNAP